MANALLSPVARQQFLTPSGAPAAGYKLTTYATGTTTPAATYSNRAGTVANPNPIVLDADGYAPAIYLTPGQVYDYKFTSDTGGVQWTQSGISADVGDATSVGFKQTGTDTIVRSVGEKLSESASIKDFGGVGDNVTDNAAAITKAEASGYASIYMPEGTYYVNLPSYLLQKKYHGPGKIRLAVGWTPGRFTQMMNVPTKGTGTDADYYFSGDTSRIKPEYFILGSSNQNVRRSLTESYFESTTTPHFEYFVNYSGGSGGDARMAASAISGASAVTLNSAAGFAAGQTVAFWNVSDGTKAHTATIGDVTGNVISFAPPLPLALGAGSAVGRGTRTMQQFRFTQLNHLGQGDAYCQTYRVTSSYVPIAGQDHFFYTSTAGAIGGDISHGTDGCYSTTFEFNANDGGKDVAHIGYVESFHRNFTGASNYGAVWLGTFLKSEGTAYAEAAHVVSGKWKRGLDTTLMTPDADKAVINLGAGQRVYLNSSATGEPKLGLAHYGNILGTCYYEYSSAVTGFNLVVNNNPRFQVTDTEVRSLVDHKLEGRLFGTVLHNNPAGMAGTTSQFVGSGTYTPTATATANVSAVTPLQCQYIRVGNVVTVSGQITITPTAASASTTWRISLPIASDLAGGANLGGTACCGNAAGMVAQIAGDGTNDAALFSAYPSTNAVNNWSFSFTYLVA